MKAALGKDYTSRWYSLGALQGMCESYDTPPSGGVDDGSPGSLFTFIAESQSQSTQLPNRTSEVFLCPFSCMKNNEVMHEPVNK